jgi:hypothetical protein
VRFLLRAKPRRDTAPNSDGELILQSSSGTEFNKLLYRDKPLDLYSSQIKEILALGNLSQSVRTNVPILNRFAHLFSADRIGCGQVGNCAGDFENANRERGRSTRYPAISMLGGKKPRALDRTRRYAFR